MQLFLKAHENTPYEISMWNSQAEKKDTMH